MLNHPLVAYPFRLFFLLAGLYALLLIGFWVGLLLGGWSIPLAISPLLWHSHEMLYGFVAAATAGFILTAITNWTSAGPLQGGRLLLLALLWLLGRLLFWFDTGLPTTMVALVDCSFLIVLTLYVASVLVKHGNQRNFILVGVLALFALGNLSIHLGLIQNQWDWVQLGTLHGLNLVTLMMVIIAGRLTPAFTRNWLRAQQQQHSVKQAPALDILSLASIAMLLLLDWFTASAAITGIVASAAALVNFLRLSQWCGWHTRTEPLLWALHLAYLWIVVALLLRGLVSFNPELPPALWQHALGVGAMGTLIMAVMTRVSVAHTGRPLKLRPLAIYCYLGVSLAALVRVLTAAQLIPYQPGILVAGLSWSLAFALFIILYWPVLSSPRVDGRPG